MGSLPYPQGKAQGVLFILCLASLMLSVAIKPIMLNVELVNVVLSSNCARLTIAILDKTLGTNSFEH